MILDALLIKASHAATEKTAFYYNICMRHGEREKKKKGWKTRLTSCQLFIGQNCLEMKEFAD